MTWSEAMYWARKQATESGIRRAVMAFWFPEYGWRYYVLAVGAKPWQNAQNRAPRERLRINEW